ncbi:hypothetical protein WDU94_002752 [Cyamophila willieti]
MSCVLLALVLVSSALTMKANEWHENYQRWQQIRVTVARPMNVDSWNDQLHRIRREANEEERGNSKDINQIKRENKTEEKTEKYYNNMETVVCASENETFVSRLKEFNEQLARIDDQFGRGDQGERFTKDELQSFLQMVEATEYRTEADNSTGDEIYLDDLMNTNVIYDDDGGIRIERPTKKYEEERSTKKIENTETHRYLENGKS